MPQTDQITIITKHLRIYEWLREAEKKTYFSGAATKASPPLELCHIRNFF